MVTRGRRLVVPFFTLGIQIAIIIFFAMTMSMLAPDSQMEPTSLIVLGCGVENGQPGPILKERLDKTIEYVANKEGITIYVTGGYDRSESLSEGRVMKNYLLEKGVTNPIIMEESSTSTFENFLYTLPMIDDKKDILVLSSDYHSLRVRLLMGRFGLKPHVAKSPTPIEEWPFHFSREILANIKTFFVDW